MSEQKSQTFLNPVLSVPWLTQTSGLRKPEENALDFPIQYGGSSQQPNKNVPAHSSVSNKRKRENESRRLKNRSMDRKIESLLLRFPGIRKYEARAALMMSNRETDKAIVLLELSNCYRREITNKNLTLGQLKNIHINLLYCQKHDDKPMKNVSFNESFYDGTSSDVLSADENKDSRKSSVVEVELDSNLPKPENKVGVVLVKTDFGYKANLLK